MATTLLPSTTIAGAVTGQVGQVIKARSAPRYLLVEAAFAYGSGGTTAKAWVQTRVSGGTWRDIMAFAFTTAAAKKFSAVNGAIALAAAIAVSDGALADDTILNGFLGSEFRVKYTTTGTYAGATSLTLSAQIGT
jgi:hypothetical protein